jgi:hypothetical protein
VPLLLLAPLSPRACRAAAGALLLEREATALAIRLATLVRGAAVAVAARRAVRVVGLLTVLALELVLAGRPRPAVDRVAADLVAAAGLAAGFAAGLAGVAADLAAADTERFAPGARVVLLRAVPVRTVALRVVVLPVAARPALRLLEPPAPEDLVPPADLEAPAAFAPAAGLAAVRARWASTITHSLSLSEEGLAPWALAIVAAFSMSAIRFFQEVAKRLSYRDFAPLSTRVSMTPAGETFLRRRLKISFCSCAMSASALSLSLMVS